MSGSELLFAALTITAFSIYGAVLMWLTLTYHDQQKLLKND
ncbi:MAG: hypothetical protein ACLGGZ_05310 [Alphaproteobacteria bacterium]|jgi:hypothetical protein